MKIKDLFFLLASILLIILIGKYINIGSILNTIFKILLPLAVGLFYSWLLDPLLNKLKKRRLMALLIFITLIIFIGLFIFLLIPVIYREVNELYDILPSIVSLLEKYKVKKYFDLIPKYTISFIKVIFGYICSIFIGLIIGLYLSIDFSYVKTFVKKISKEKIDMVITLSNNLRKCIKGILLISFLVFIFDLIGFLIIKLDAPLLIAFICGLTDLIPYLGPYIGGILAVVVGLTESTKLGVMSAICCIIVQILENYVLQPLVMSKCMKINPLIIIIGLMIFGNLFGIIGMIIATPMICLISSYIEYKYKFNFTN